jgi:2,3-bisphosphoglycerate-dependent phosphoglycerate mutase
MIKVVFLRHGQSTWNLENRFTGWTDVDLTSRGTEEAQEAGKLLKDNGFVFDLAFTSVLKRAIRTLWLVQDVMDNMWLPVEKDWRLNERHYGALQGLNKIEIQDHYGAEQVYRWRRGYSVQPPALNYSDPRHPRFDGRYSHLSSEILPATESLENTLRRTTAYWERAIVPQIQQGKRVLIVAHGNSLRALIKRLEELTDTEIMQLNIPTGIPLVYEFDDNLQVLAHYYLAEQEKVQSAIDEVARQARRATSKVG